MAALFICRFLSMDFRRNRGDSIDRILSGWYNEWEDKERRSVHHKWTKATVQTNLRYFTY